MERKKEGEVEGEGRRSDGEEKGLDEVESTQGRTRKPGRHALALTHTH